MASKNFRNLLLINHDDGFIDDDELLFHTTSIHRETWTFRRILTHLLTWKQGGLVFVGGSALALGYAAFRFLGTFAEIKDAKFAKAYYGSVATGNASLPESAKVPEETARKWLIKQALWRIYSPAPRYVPSKINMPSSNAVQQADLLFSGPRKASTWPQSLRE